jgi:phage terminase large subunit-like protein
VLRPAIRLKGTKPARIFISGTPSPVPLVIRLDERLKAEDPTLCVTMGRTKDNYKNLDPGMISELEAQYAGTRFYQQEMEGKLLREAENALWTQQMIEDAHLVFQKIEFDRIAIGLDPAVSSEKDADETGIILAAAKGNIAYVIGDYSVRTSALEWARRAIKACSRHNAGSLVYERNLAGPLINDVLNKTLQELDVPVRLIPINAKGKKQARHEPIAALYEAGRVRHMPNPHETWGCLDVLESQMTTWEPTLTNSPDRIDALSLVIRHLLIKPPRTSIFIAE